LVPIEEGYIEAMKMQTLLTG